MSGKSPSFGQLLLECVDEGLAVLGNEPRLAVYHYLSTICSIPRDEIPERVEDFAAGLRKALGGASKVIERLILRRLYQKLGSALREGGDQEFADYVRGAKSRFDIVSQKRGPLDDNMEISRSKKGQFSG